MLINDDPRPLLSGVGVSELAVMDQFDAKDRQIMLITEGGRNRVNHLYVLWVVNPVIH